MMTTEAQLRANQENAKKSTGPNTLEGKKRSSQNAMTQINKCHFHNINFKINSFRNVI